MNLRGNLAGGGIDEGLPHPRIKGKRLPSVVADPEKPGLMLPRDVRDLTILEDADGKDPLSTRAMVTRSIGKFRNAGCPVIRVASPEIGRDFNDMVTGAT